MRVPRIIFGLFFAVFSATVVASIIPGLAFAFCSITSCYEWDQDKYLSFENYVFALGKIVFIVWVIAWLVVEVRHQRRGSSRTPKLLVHLLFGPIAIMILMPVFVFFCDMGLIEYSRWKITWYIHSNASPLKAPSFTLHNDYRGGCGNGAIAHIYGLYGDVPLGELKSKDAAVRARALQAEIYVADWLNGVDEDFTKVLDEARHDPDPTVKKIADDCYVEMNRYK